MFVWSVSTSIVALVALGASQASNGWTAAVGIGVIIFLAAFTAGALLGFLFGIPRVLSRDVTSTSGAVGNGDSPSRALGSNTNLERVSDWLTTLLVGVGLSQLHEINDGLTAFAGFIDAQAKVFTAADGTADAGILPAVAPPFLIAGTIVGFLLMYLYTRTSLLRVLNAVEQDLLTGGVRKAVQQTAGRIAGQTGNFLASQVSKSNAVSVEDALDVMFHALYRPQGYKDVIELAGRLSQTAAVDRPQYWFYLAAAFGQQMADRGDQDPARADDRRNALDAAARAVRLDPSYKRRLLDIADPNGADRDLTPLWGDPEFLRIVS
jgi:hypothetical protein